MGYKNFSRLATGVLILGVASLSSAQTYGNTSEFDDVSSHSPNYVLGVQVTIPTAVTLQSFGLIYGLGSTAESSMAKFAVYDSNPDNAGLPGNLVAYTDALLVDTAQYYDNIPFATTPTVNAGTYWMMAMYESFATPRMDGDDSGSLVAYWGNTYGFGLPAVAPTVDTYFGQNFNYWVNTSDAVPEPASMAVLGLGAAALLRRRKKS